MLSAIPRISLIKKFGFNFKNKNCLDIGCSLGGFLYLAKRKGSNCCGVEPFEEYAKYASKYHDKNIYSGFIENYDNNSEFDLISLFGVFQYFEDPDYVLKKIKSMMHSDSLLVIAGLPHVKKINFEDENTIQPYRAFLHSSKSIKILLERNGFEIQELYYSPEKLEKSFLEKLHILLLTSFDVLNYVIGLNKTLNNYFKKVEDINTVEGSLTIICSKK